MDVQMQHFDEMNDRGEELVMLVNNDPAAVEKINSQLQEFQERWDNLVQQMEYQSKEVGLYSVPPRGGLCTPSLGSGGLLEQDWVPEHGGAT